MINLKNPSQIEKMREAGKLLYEVEQQVRTAIRPGITTADLDVLAERGLIHLDSGSGTISIRLTPGPDKVDLERSAIMIRLKKEEGDV